MHDVERSAEAIADRLGPALVYLQPANEKRFDPVTLGVIVALYLLKAVADGAVEAIKSSTQKVTESALDRTATAIRREVHRLLPEAMSDAGEERLEEAATATSVAWSGPPQESIVLSNEQIISAAGAAVEGALAEAGMPATRAAAIADAVRTQVRVLLTDRDATWSLPG